MAVKQLKATCATLQSENKRLAALAQRKDVWTPRPEFRDIASHTNDRLYYDPKQRTADVVKDLYKEIHRLADVIKEQVTPSVMLGVTVSVSAKNGLFCLGPVEWMCTL